MLQIPEELSVPISSLQHQGVNQSPQTSGEYNNPSDFTSAVNASSSPGFYNNAQVASGSYGAHEDYDEDFIDNNHVQDMSGMNPGIQRELSLAEELSQSMHEEQQHADSEQDKDGGLHGSVSAGSDGRGVHQEAGERHATESESVYDKLIDRVLTGCGRRREPLPDIHSMSHFFL